MIEQGPASKPDVWYDAAAVQLVQYDDCPVALEIITKEGKRVGIGISRGILAGLLMHGKAAIKPDH